MKRNVLSKTRAFVRGAAVVLSAFLFLLIVAVWVRSYFVSDWIRIMHATEGPEYDVMVDGHPVGHRDEFEREWGFQHGRGRIGVSLERRTNRSSDAQPGFNWQPIGPTAIDIGGLAGLADVFFNRFGFGVIKMRERGDPGTSSETVGVVLPLWFAALVTGVLPALWLARWRRESIAANRRRAGQCAGCGYDLRESPDRCPECGAAPAPA